MLEKVGIREFRTHLAKYLNASSPIAVMRHGQTVGYFFPAQPKPAFSEIEALKRAAEKLDALLQENGLTEELLLEEFRQLREQKR